MPDILDESLRDVAGENVGARAYGVVVSRVAEWRPAVQREWPVATGNALPDPPAAEGTWAHIWWRCTVEREQWGTTRGAIHSRPASTTPVTPIEIPNPPDSGAIGPASGRLIQVTDEPGIVNRGYGYYSQSWLRSDGIALVIVPTKNGPILFEVNVASGAVSRIGPIPGYGLEGEGMWFDREGRLTATDGPRLRRYRPPDGPSEILFDISERFPGCRLWQAHSSEDGTVHSATVEKIVPEGAYPRLGTFLWRRGETFWWASMGALDESQVDASGDFLIIKERHDNLIIDLDRMNVQILTDEGGALGHSDCGHGFAVGEDNQIGACVRLDLRTLERRKLFDTWNMGEVSIRGGRMLHSDAMNRNLALVDMNTGARQVLIEHGMRGTGSEYQTHGNLSPCGKLAAFVSNRTGAFQMYLLVL